MAEDPKVCSNCGGSGKIRVNDDTTKDCWCRFGPKFRARVGAEIFSVPTLRQSPLFVVGASKEDTVDLSKTNLHLTGEWYDILQHLKYTLIFKQLEYDFHYCFRVTTDERLKSVYLGSESYKAKKAKDRDLETSVSFNSLNDYIGEDLHLVVIKLGVVSYPNRALPGLIKEALEIRLAANLPTWVVDSHRVPFRDGHFAYSPDLGEYLGLYYKQINLSPGSVAVTPVHQKNDFYSSEEGISLDQDDVSDPDQEEPEERPPVRQSKPKSTQQEHNDHAKDNDLSFLTEDKGYKKKGRNGGGNSNGKGGGGPL